MILLNLRLLVRWVILVISKNFVYWVVVVLLLATIVSNVVFYVGFWNLFFVLVCSAFLFWFIDKYVEYRRAEK